MTSPRTAALRDKVARLLVVRLGSNMVPPRRAEADAPAVADLLRRYPLGGVILFNGRWPETPATLAALQALSADGLLVMTDMERGLGQQVHPDAATASADAAPAPTVFPHLRAFGALPPDEAEAAVRAFAEAGAREALAAGVHVAFAPVADVNREPRNPIIATRAFGETPALVGRLVRAYIEAARGAGLLTTAKHFPGHGGTADDSHAVLPVVRDDRATLDATDLAPFRAALDAGVDLVMTAHVAYPALDPSGTPATASRPILVDLLRGEMGFQGPVITDSLHMGGIQQDGRTEADRAADLLAAGVDLLLDAHDPEAIIEGVAAAVEAGRLPEARLDEAAARAEALRARLRARFGPDVFRAPGVPLGAVGAPDHAALADDVARRALVVLDGAVPAHGDGAGLAVVLVRPHASPLDPPAQPLAEAVARALPRATYHEVSPDAAEAALDAARRAAEAAERLAVAVVVKPAAWRAFGLPEREHALVAELAHARPTVLAALGSPLGLDGLPAATARVCTYSDVAAAQRALADALAEGRPA